MKSMFYTFVIAVAGFAVFAYGLDNLLHHPEYSWMLSWLSMGLGMACLWLAYKDFKGQWKVLKGAAGPFGDSASMGNNKYMYAFILGSDQEAEELDQEMLRRGVRAEYFIGKRSGCRGYRFPTEDLDKLPVDESGSYFGDEEGGVGFRDEAFILDMKADIATTDWMSVGDQGAPRSGQS